MTILLTGAAGFIGSNLADQLLAPGHRVIGLDNFDDFYAPKIKRTNTSQQILSSSYRLIEGDIRDAALLANIFSEEKIDLVIHLAARAGVRPSIQFPALYFDVNLNGTLCLLEAMKQANVKRMVFASSSSVYGNNPKVPFSETDNVDFPISPYAASKKAGELLCHTYHHLHNFDIFCLRFFTVYGPRQRPEMAIHYFTDCIAKGKPINVYGDGGTKRDYTFIDDITQGIIAAAINLRGYEIINLGESKTVTLAYLIEVIENALGQKAILNRLPMQPGDVELTNADISKAQSLIGYAPKFGIEEGVKRFVEWYKSQSK